MNEILQGILKALELIITLDPEVVDITSRTLMISLSSTLLASLIAAPVGAIIHFKQFKGKRAIINIIQTLYSIPTVLVGLLVFLLISRSGPLGSLNLLFTPWGMILAQAMLISPLIMGFSITALKGVGEEIMDLARSLGATEYQTLFTLVSEARYGIMAAIILGFGRAISEVGIAIMIGGNIRGYTRVITSAMALETSKGNLELSIALGIILLGVSLIINTLLNYFQER